MKKYKLDGFIKSKAKGKMYAALLRSLENGRIIKVNFGDNKMGNYSDKTCLNLYPHLIHGDSKRREKYISRHKGFIKKGFFSPGYFSMKYLWG